MLYDSVISLLYEMDANLVERAVFLPVLDEVAERIGFKGNVTLAGYAKYLKIFYEVINIEGNRSSGALLAEDHWRLTAVNMAIRKYGNQSERKRVLAIAGLAPDVLGQLEMGGKTGIRVASLNGRNPVLKELAVHGGWFARWHAEEAMRIREAIRSKISSKAASLEELLKPELKRSSI